MLFGLFKAARRKWRTARKRRRIRSCVVSFPKAGRTWLRMMIGKALAEQFGLNEGDALDHIERLAKRAGAPPFDFTHDGAVAGEVDPSQGRMEDSKRKYRSKKVLLLVRDPRDMVVSYYFEATRRRGWFQGALSEFIRDEEYGVPRIVRFHRIWQENRGAPQAFMAMRYEDMHRDPAAALRQALDFLGCQAVGEAAIRAAVEFARFENMKKMERQGAFQSDKLRPGDAADAESYKTRRGIVGGYVDYLSDEDRAWIAEAIERLGCPFYSQAAQVESP